MGTGRGACWDGPYPEPVIDHLAAARHAREQVWAVRRAQGFAGDAAQIQNRHGSHKSGMRQVGRKLARTPGGLPPRKPQRANRDNSAANSPSASLFRRKGRAGRNGNAPQIRPAPKKPAPSACALSPGAKKWARDWESVRLLLGSAAAAKHAAAKDGIGIMTRPGSAGYRSNAISQRFP